MLDMFGGQLEVGQHVFYADYGDDNEPVLSIYRIIEVVFPDVCKGELLDTTGNWFYLEDTTKRVVIIGDARTLYNLTEYYRDSTIN